MSKEIVKELCTKAKEYNRIDYVNDKLRSIISELDNEYDKNISKEKEIIEFKNSLIKKYPKFTQFINTISFEDLHDHPFRTGLFNVFNIEENIYFNNYEIEEDYYSYLNDEMEFELVFCDRFKIYSTLKFGGDAFGDYGFYNIDYTSSLINYDYTEIINENLKETEKEIIKEIICHYFPNEEFNEKVTELVN